MSRPLVRSSPTVTWFESVSQFEFDFIKLSVSHSHLDVFAKEVGTETQPVSGDVEAALEEDVSEESTGVHWGQETEREHKTQVLQL